MDAVEVERLGGLAGFGGTRSRLRSRGRIDLATLTPERRRTLDELFDKPGGSASPAVPDAFRYKLTRATPDGPRTVEVPESRVPSWIAEAVRDELL